MFNHPDFTRHIETGAAIVRRWYESQGKEVPRIDLHRSGITTKGQNEYIVINGPRAVLLVAKIIDHKGGIVPVNYDEWPQPAKDMDTLYRSQLAQLKTLPDDRAALGIIPDRVPYNVTQLRSVAVDVAFEVSNRERARELLKTPL